MTSGAAASRYARALFDVLLKEHGDLDKAETDLGAFANLLSQHPVLATTLRNPAIPIAKKKAVVQSILDRDGSVSPVVAKLILMLAERDRLRLLPDLLRTYRDRLMDHQQVIRGEVTTAMPIDADKLRALEQGFAKDLKIGKRNRVRQCRDAGTFSGTD